MNIKFIPFFLFLHALSFSSHFNSAAARGGSRLSGSSDFARSTRHLFDEKQWSLEKHLRHLDKLAEGYMSNADLELAMKEFNHRCPNISRIYSIGESVLGVPLWVMEISDKAGKEEPEPAFKFIGNVHGDEPVGRELLMLLANWLCKNYMKDYLATLIVDSVHLHLLPSLNPDGFSLRRRGNANNVDLNRDFPDQFFPMNDDPGTHQPETKAIMKWLEETRFTASASLHGGALVANYPWDGTRNKKKEYSACPDDETFRFMASIYSNSHRNMSLSEEFPRGITNGAQWYPIYGGMQDWNYIHNGCFELTLEISDNKWPNITEIPDIWEFNKMGMLSLVASLVKSGIHGRVFSSDRGSPLPASISIKGINYTIKAGKVFADYHRLVAPGEKYEVGASMPGYKSKSTSIIHGDEASTVDFILDPVDTQKNGILSRVICDCGLQNGSLKLLTFSPVEHLEVYFIVIPILLFLCILMRRRMVSNRTKQKQLIGPKRPVVV